MHVVDGGVGHEGGVHLKVQGHLLNGLGGEQAVDQGKVRHEFEPRIVGQNIDAGRVCTCLEMPERRGGVVGQEVLLGLFGILVVRALLRGRPHAQVRLVAPERRT